MKKILCLGDSNTYGYEPRSYFGSRYAENVRWTGLLAKNGFIVINLGSNGKCIPESNVLKGTQNLIQQYLPSDLITITLGTNDILQRETAEEAASKMDAFVRSIYKYKEEAKILLIAPPILKQGAWVSNETLINESSQLSAMYQEIAKKRKIWFADAGTWDIDVLFDGVHFSEEGHRAFAEGLMEELEELGF